MIRRSFGGSVLMSGLVGISFIILWCFYALQRSSGHVATDNSSVVFLSCSGCLKSPQQQQEPQAMQLNFFTWVDWSSSVPLRTRISSMVFS